MTDLLHIHNWDKWQTYRRDRPCGPWIKAHRRLLQDRKWVSLTDEQRGHLFSIWLLAAQDGGSVPNDAAYIKLVCCLRAEPDLNLFIEMGFLDTKREPLGRQTSVLDKSRLEESREEEIINNIRKSLLCVLDAKHAKAVIEHRKNIRQPLTELAAERLAKQLGKWPDPNEAADEMMLRGWRGFDPEWMHSKGNGRGTGPPRGETVVETIDRVGRMMIERDKQNARANENGAGDEGPGSQIREDDYQLIPPLPKARRP